MSIFDRLKSAFTGHNQNQRIKLTDTGKPLFWDIDFVGYSYNDRDFREFIRNAFGRNPIVNMVVPRLAETQAALPRSWRSADGELLEPSQVDRELLRLISQPNKTTSRREFYNLIDQYYLVTGNAIVYGLAPIIGNSEAMQSLGMQKYTELYIASIEDVNIITADGTVNSEPVAYEITRAYNSSATVTIDAKDVLHLKNPNIVSPNTNYGLSKLFGQQKAYTASTLTFEARNNAYTNGGKSGVLSPKGSETIMLPVEQKAMQERFDHDTTGVHNFGGVHVSGAPVDYTRISLSPEQLQLIESVPTDLRHLCAVYNVDPMLFGDSEGAKFDNLKTAEARMEKTATMNGSLYDDELNRWLIQGNYDLDICYKIDEKDEAKEAKLMQRNTDKGKEQVTGIVKSFKADELDKAAAIGNLIIQYAYTEDEAKILLGL